MKKFFVSTIIALACVGASAQVETTPVKLGDGYMYGIPDPYTYNEEYKMVFVEFDGDKNAGNMRVYDGELNLVKDIKVTEEPLHLESKDMTDGGFQGATVFLTQTLFNDDEKYEYVVGIPDESDSYGGRISGFKIVSEDGTVLQTISFGMGASSEPDIIGWGLGNRYLAFEMYEDNESWNSSLNLYKINKSADPSKVSVATAPVRISVSPRVAERSQDITVVAEGEGIREVVVTDAAGRIVYSTKAAAGQQTVKINSRHLSSGLNVVSVKSADGKNENCKVIVKK